MCQCWLNMYNNRWICDDVSLYIADIASELSHCMGDTPKWMVYKGKSEHKVNDLGAPPFQETSI